MAEIRTSAPLDLATIGDLTPPLPAESPSAQGKALAAADTRLLPQPRLDRLVEVANLNPDEGAFLRCVHL